MRIVTISREFGSGGRELGKRLADELGFAYYDSEILTEIANRAHVDENFVENVLNRSYTVDYAYSFRHTFARLSSMSHQAMELFAKQSEVLHTIAEKGEDCVIVGRGADVTLAEYNPFKLFVYADMPSKIERCKERADINERLSDKEIERRAKEIDKARAYYHDVDAEFKWGRKEAYHLCVNTTGVEIKDMIPSLAAYAARWFVKKGR